MIFPNFGLQRVRVLHSIAVLTVIACGSVLATTSSIHITHPYDKIAHLSGFAVFTLVFGSYIRSFFWAMIIAISAGFAVEVVQLFIPHRGFSWMDVGADSLGALLVWSLFLLKSSLGMHPQNVGRNLGFEAEQFVVHDADLWPIHSDMSVDFEQTAHSSSVSR